MVDITKDEAAKLAAEYGSKVITAIELNLNRNPFNDAESAAHYGRIALEQDTMQVSEIKQGDLSGTESHPMADEYNKLGRKLWSKARKTGEDGLRFLTDNQLKNLTPDERCWVKFGHISFSTCDYGMDAVDFHGRYFIVRK